jgi:hypothetical protein
VLEEEARRVRKTRGGIGEERRTLQYTITIRSTELLELGVVSLTPYLCLYTSCQ